MPNCNEHIKKRIEAFSSGYMGKLFYFYLKKTGSTTEAEDLASDAAISIISELRKGVIPTHFSAWVWKIARNRYSRWALKKNRTLKIISETGISDPDIADEEAVEEVILHSEDIKLLRRELAFISRDYRNILVAYYIENRGINEISAIYGYAAGTVKSKLFRSRKLLKEGIQMAREFGTKSYKPEEVRFAASGNQPSALPWSAVSRKIPKNILLHAHNNPCTAEELAIELGIAMPYMEEEIQILCSATLLKKIDGEKYITNFFIADAECQMAIYQAERLYSKERSEQLDKLISEILPEVKNLNLMRNCMGDRDLKWLLMISSLDFIIKNAEGYDITCREKRNDGGNWGFMGFETCDLQEELVMGHNGCGDGTKGMFWSYKISGYELWNRVGEMNYDSTLLLADIVSNKRKFSSFTPSELLIWKNIGGRFAHTEDDIIIPDIAVFEKDAFEKYHALIKEHPLYGALSEKYQTVFNSIMKILKKHTNPILLVQLNYYASMFMCDTRMMMIHDEVEAGRLSVPENPNESTIAMWLELK